MTTFGLTADGTAAVAPRTAPTPGRARAHRTRPAPRARRRRFRTGSLWLHVALFTAALGAGLVTGYLLGR